jgi:molecular chaperone DnaK (HSP70)
MRATIDYAIDLSVTQCIAAVAENDQPNLVRLRTPTPYLPLVVHIDAKGEVHLGRSARLKLESDPENTKAFFLGYLGKEQVFNFPASKKNLTAEDLLTLVLSALHKDIEQNRSEEVLGVVISIPSGFTAPMRDGIEHAAHQAAFKSVVLLNRPIAIGRAYGVALLPPQAACLVLDIGESACETAVIFHQSPEVRQLSTISDGYTHSHVLDWMVVDQILAPTAARMFSLADFRRENPRWRGAFSKLISFAEIARTHLVSAQNYPITSDYLCKDDSGDPVPFECELKRADLQRLAQALAQRVVDLCRKALSEAGVEVKRIERILYAGDATLLPYLKDAIEDKRNGLGCKVDTSIDPRNVVAYGAAIYANHCPLVIPEEPPPVEDVPELSDEVIIEEAVVEPPAVEQAALQSEISMEPVQQPEESVANVEVEQVPVASELVEEQSVSAEPGLPESLVEIAEEAEPEALPMEHVEVVETKCESVPEAESTPAEEKTQPVGVQVSLDIPEEPHKDTESLAELLPPEPMDAKDEEVKVSESEGQAEVLDVATPLVVEIQRTSRMEEGMTGDILENETAESMEALRQEFTIAYQQILETQQTLLDNIAAIQVAQAQLSLLTPSSSAELQALRQEINAQLLAITAVQQRLVDQLVGLKASKSEEILPQTVSLADLEALRREMIDRLDAIAQAQQQGGSTLPVAAKAPERSLPAELLSALINAIPDTHITQVGNHAILQFEHGLFARETILTDDGNRILNQLGQQLKPFVGKVQVTLIGFQDDSEADGYFSLGLLRSLRICDLLVRGPRLPANMFMIQPRGEMPSPFSNDTQENQARNRTIEIHLAPVEE